MFLTSVFQLLCVNPCSRAQLVELVPSSPFLCSSLDLCRVLYCILALSSRDLHICAAISVLRTWATVDPRPTLQSLSKVRFSLFGCKCHLTLATSLLRIPGSARLWGCWCACAKGTTTLNWPWCPWPGDSLGSVVA